MQNAFQTLGSSDAEAARERGREQMRLSQSSIDADRTLRAATGQKATLADRTAAQARQTATQTPDAARIRALEAEVLADGPQANAAAAALRRMGKRA